jgi:hypothetical protein
MNIKTKYYRVVNVMSEVYSMPIQAANVTCFYYNQLSIAAGRDKLQCTEEVRDVNSDHSCEYQKAYILVHFAILTWNLSHRPYLKPILMISVRFKTLS